MEIKTKFNLDEPCWIMFSNKPEQVSVKLHSVLWVF